MTMSDPIKIPLSRPLIEDDDIQAVLEVLKSPQLSLGPQTLAFEELFANTMNSQFAIAVNSGTSGLHVCIRALGIKEGDEVITTPFSFIASANCILFEKATPVFVDIEEQSFNIDPARIEAAITPRTKAIIPVHVFGHSANMKAIMQIAEKHQLYVIEDACEAPLALHHQKIAGTYGDFGVYGFYPNKQMTTGEGGMIITDNEQLYTLCKSLRNQGRGDSLQWLSHDRLGYNYRISELTAALGRSQTAKLKRIIESRRAVAHLYQHHLADIEEIKLPVTLENDLHSWFVFGIRVDKQIRDQLIKELNNRGIQSKAYFFPCIHLQTFYRETFGYKEGDFPLAEKISQEMVILPFFTAMQEEQILLVKNALKDALSSIKVSG